MDQPRTDPLARHTRDFPCPVCGGYANLPKGRGVRCAGFTVGRLCFCTREEHAGRAVLDISVEPPAFRHYLVGACVCGTEHGSPGRIAAQQSPPGPQLSIDVRDAIFSFALRQLGLRKEARVDLTRRGLTDADISEVGYRSIPTSSEREPFLKALVNEFGESLVRQCPGFTDKNSRTSFWTASGDRDGYIVPYRNEQGLITGLQQKRLHDARYETARLSRTAEMFHVAGLLTAGADVYVTEGGLKAQVASCLAGLAVVGLPGQSLAAEHVAVLRLLQPGRVVEALDQEANESTDRARERWHHTLTEAGLPVYRAVWEGSDVGGPKGLDDLFAAGGRPRLRLVELVPPETGAKRSVRPAIQRGATTNGVSQSEARRMTRDAIEAFVAGAGSRR